MIHFHSAIDSSAWVAYFALALAVVYVMTRSAIARPLRLALVPPGMATEQHPWLLNALTLIMCPHCFGFWTGVALGALHFLPLTSGILGLDMFVSGCLTMVVAGAWFHWLDPGEMLLRDEHPELFEETDVETTKGEEGSGE